MIKSKHDDFIKNSRQNLICVTIKRKNFRDNLYKEQVHCSLWTHNFSANFFFRQAASALSQNPSHDNQKI